MATETTGILRRLLNEMAAGYNALVRERQALQQAQTRIPAINASVQVLLDEAQKVLDRYNALEGTAYTLADIRKQIEGD